MGCDFFTANSHKWLTGPKEAGILYVRTGSEDHLWAADVGVGWEGARDDGARTFETVGQRDDACVAAMATAVGVDTREAYARLYDEHRIAGAGMGGGIRLSPHFYNTLEDIERAVDAVATVAA